MRKSLLGSTSIAQKEQPPVGNFGLPDPIFTASQTAEELKIHRRTLERWRQTGEGPVYIRLGRRVCYRLSDVNRFINANLHKSTSEAALDRGSE